jgi:hypothetical protein
MVAPDFLQKCMEDRNSNGCRSGWDLQCLSDFIEKIDLIKFGLDNSNEKSEAKSIRFEKN